MHEERNRHVDEDCELDSGNQDNRKRYRLQDEENDHGDHRNGCPVDNREVCVRCLNQILRTGRFADQHAVLVIALDDLLNLVALLVHLIGSKLVVRHDDEHPPVLAVERIPELGRDHFLRELRADNVVDSEYSRDAVQIPDLLLHLLHVLAADRLRRENHFRGTHVKIVFQLCVRLDRRKTLRKCPRQIIVDVRVALPIGCREPDEAKHNQKNRIILLYPVRNPLEIRYDRLVPRLLERLVQHQDQGRKHSDNCHDTEQDTLRHDKPEVNAKTVCHEAHRQEPCNRRDGGSDDRRQGRLDGGCHCVLRIVRMAVSLFDIGMPEENGVIQRHTKLKDCSQCLRDIGNLSENPVGSHVVEDCHSDGYQEKQRCHEGIHRQLEDDQTQYDGQNHINRCFLICQRLCIDQSRRHAADKALLLRNFAERFNRIARLI